MSPSTVVPTPKMPTDDPFRSAERYYASHRPDYGDPPVAHLADSFDLGADDRVLDLGCGTGQVAVPLADHVGAVVGMDPNSRMLGFAREHAREAGSENVEWVRGSDADLRGESGERLCPFTLTTMARSFHWMDRGPTLDRLRELTEPGGGVAILGDTEWLASGRRDWQDAVYAVAADYLDDLPERAGPRTEPYENPYDELLADHGFVDVTVETFERTREWSVDGVVGYVFSLSFCAPEEFGEEAEAFETDLRERLGGRDGPFPQDDDVRVISGRKPG